MSNPLQHQKPLFTAPERDLIRREMGMHFGQNPSLADGIYLRTWRAGDRKGQPKIPPAMESCCGTTATWIQFALRICALSLDWMRSIAKRQAHVRAFRQEGHWRWHRDTISRWQIERGNGRYEHVRCC
jgi:hypothetical protein